MDLNINPFQITHIVELIFQYLPSRVLSNCACVCKLWNSISCEEQKKRRKIVWFFQGIKCKQHNEMHQFSGNCTMENSSQFETELREQLRNVGMKPAFCIAFATSGFLENFEQLFPSHFKPNKHRRKKMKLKEDDEYRHKFLDLVIRIALRSNLPYSCKVACFVGKNIVATKQDMNRLEVREVAAISGCLFPDFPDGEIKLCKRNFQKFDLLKIIGRDCKIESMLALAEHKPMIYLSVALHERRHIVSIPETGCAYLVQRENGYIPVFSGPNVLTACLWGESLRCEEILRENLRENGFFKNQNIAFLFSQSDYYSHIDTFHNILPETPIVGLFGTAKVEGDDEKEIKFIKSYFPKCLTDTQLSCYMKCIIVSFKSLPLF